MKMNTAILDNTNITKLQLKMTDKKYMQIKKYIIINK